MKERQSVDQCSIFPQIAKTFFGRSIIKQLLPLCEGNMAICSPEARNTAQGRNKNIMILHRMICV